MNYPTHAGDGVRSVIYWLRDNPGPHRAQDIADAIGEQTSSVRVYLRRSLKYGFVTNPGRGLYEIRPGAHPLFFDRPSEWRSNANT